MPSFSEMDKGSEEQNDYQQMLERNNNLEEEIKKMKSDFIILKQKIICTDTLIKKIQEKHKYCEILERKYSDLRKITDTLKRECEVHTSEYQGLLLKFGPLKQEKETFEWRCTQLNEEVEQLKNSIRCHEVVQNQMKEANKNQQQDFENCKKENKLLQDKLNKLNQLCKNSEKRQAPYEKEPICFQQQKQKFPKRTSKQLVLNGVEDEEDITLREMALNIEAQFATVEVTEMCTFNGETTNEVNKDKRKVPRKINSIEGKTKKLYSIKSTSKAKRRGIKSVQDVNLISQWKMKKKSKSINDHQIRVADNDTHSLMGHTGGGNPQNSPNTPFAGKEPSDQCANIDSERRLALLYEDLLMSSDEESYCFQNEPSCSLTAHNPPTIIAPISASVVNNSNVNLINEKGDLIVCDERTNAPKVFKTQVNGVEGEGESQAVVKISSSVKDILVDAGITLTSNEENHNLPLIRRDKQFFQLPVEIEESNIIACKVNGSIDKNIFNHSCSSRDFFNAEEKSTSFTNEKQFGTEIDCMITEVKTLNCAKESRKRKIANDSMNVDHKIPISFEKFEELQIEDVLKVVGINRPLSPLASRSSSVANVENMKNNVVDAMGHVPTSRPDPPENLTRNKNVKCTLIKSNPKHSDPGNVSNCTLNCGEFPQMLRDVYYNMQRLMKFSKQPLSPFLFEARNLKISGMPFVRIIMKIIQKYSTNVLKFWFEHQSLSDNPHTHPWLPPPILRLVEILISCGTSLDQGKATLELFMVNSFALIIYYYWGERQTKYKECFMLCLSCCVVAILRTQGNMERVRMLLYEVLRNSCESSRICTVVMTICAVWPQSLMLNNGARNDFSSVQQVLRYYVMTSIKYQNTEKCFIKQLCGWEEVEQSPDEVISKLFQQIEQFYNQSGISQDVVSKSSWELQMAVMLLCSREGWDWTSAMVSKFLWPFLGAWANGNSTSDHFVQLVIDSLGICLSQYLEKIDSENFIKVFDNLKLLVMQNSVSLDIRESALRSVLRLSHHSSFPCQLIPFVNQYRSLFSEYTHVLLGLFNI